MARVSMSLCFVLLAFALVGVSTAIPRKMVGTYELKKGDFSVRVTNWGATILSVVLPDAKGNLTDVVLGFDGIGPYINDTIYFGALVGRVANRVADSEFQLGGHKYKLFPNDGENSLHGGHRGFNRVIWTVEDIQIDGPSPYITLHYHSFDGEQGYPGDLDVYVTFQIVGDYEFSVNMTAIPRNKPTPVNLAEHSYWNLGGHDSGTILSNVVQIFGSHVTPVNKELIPTGEIEPVAGTAYDFLQPNTVGSRIKEAYNGGYDMNYALDSPLDKNGMRKAAVVKDDKSGRVLELWTNQPGLQFYTAGMLTSVVGKDGAIYHQHQALCLETQGFPNAVNQPNFPSQIVNPGEVYRHHMLYKFSFQ